MTSPTTGDVFGRRKATPKTVLATVALGAGAALVAVAIILLSWRWAAAGGWLWLFAAGVEPPAEKR